MACRTRIHTEISGWKGHETLSTFLDCSKCYERIEQYVAVQRAIDSGFPDRISNLNASIYSGSRYVRVHGAVAQPAKGRHGLIAGYSFAKDLLKAFLKPIAAIGQYTVFRDYVDDMVVTATGRTAEEAANKLKKKTSLI